MEWELIQNETKEVKKRGFMARVKEMRIEISKSDIIWPSRSFTSALQLVNLFNFYLRVYIFA